MSDRRIRWAFLVLMVAVLTLAVPAAALAQDGGGSTGSGAKIDVPGIFSLLMGAGGSGQGGSLVLGPMQFDLASLNSSAKVEGLKFGNGQFDWDTLQISQNQPSVAGPLQVSDAQATIRGPSTGYTSDATAHIALAGPNQAVQGEATLGLGYDGLARSLGVMVGGANLTANTAPVGVKVSNLNTGSGTLTADQAMLTFPATGGNLTADGLQLGSAGTSWNQLMLNQPSMQLGNSTTLSDLTLIVHGPNEGYATEGGVKVEFNAGDLGHAEAQIGLMYDPSSGKFYGAVSNGSVTLATQGMSVQLSGISYVGSTLTIDTVSLSVPPVRLEGEISGVTVSSGNVVDFQQAYIRYMADPAAGGTFGGVQFTVQKVQGSYLLTTQTLLTPAATK